MGSRTNLRLMGLAEPIQPMLMAPLLSHSLDNQVVVIVSMYSYTLFNAAQPGVSRVQVLGSKKLQKKTQLFGVDIKIEKQGGFKGAKWCLKFPSPGVPGPGGSSAQGGVPDPGVSQDQGVSILNIILPTGWAGFSDQSSSLVLFFRAMNFLSFCFKIGNQHFA